jgi:TP901 family phage tail tape measure protein
MAGEKNVGTLLAKIRADAQQFVATFEKAKGQAGNLSKSVEATGAAFRGAAVLTGAFAVGVGGIVKVTGDFEQTMANVGAVTGAVGDDLDELGSIAVEMGKSTIFSASEAGKAMFNLGSAGIKTASDFKNILKPSLDLAAAAQSDISFVTETLIGNIRAFGLETTDAGRVANLFSAANENSALTAERLGNALRPIAPLAGSMGVSIENTTAALGTLVNRNFQAEEAGTALRNIFINLQKPVGDAKKLLVKAGFDIAEMGEKVKDPVALMKELRDANFSTAEATAIFGKRAVGAFQAMAAGVDDMEDLRDSITGTDSASRIATRQLDTFNSQVKLMKSALEALVITIGTKLLPVFRRWVERATEMIGTAIDFVEANGELVKELILGAGKFLLITTAALGFLSILLKILVVGPQLIALIKVITLGMPWAALAAAIGFVIVKIIDMRIKVLEAKSAMAGLLATNKKMAENFGKTADQLKAVNGDFDRANEIIAERGIKLPFVIKSEKELARAIKIVEGAQKSRIEADEALTTAEKENSVERAEAKREEEKAKMEAELEKLGIVLDANTETTQTMSDQARGFTDEELARFNEQKAAFRNLATAGKITWSDYYNFLQKEGGKFQDGELKRWASWFRMVDQVTSGVERAFSDVMFDMWTGAKGFNEAVAAAWAGLRKMIIRAIADMIAQWLTFVAIRAATKFLTGGLFGKGGTVEGFQAGGVPRIPAGEDVLIAAQVGEGILTKRTVDALGGSQAIDELNAAGEAGALGGRAMTVNVNVESPTGDLPQTTIDRIVQAVQESQLQVEGGT